MQLAELEEYSMRRNWQIIEAYVDLCLAIEKCIRSFSLKALWMA